MKQEEIKKSLLDELGLANLPQEKKEELVAKMTEVVLKRIFLKTMESLDEKGQEEYSQIVDAGGPPEKLEEFLDTKIKNYDQMVKDVLAQFREEMKTGMGMNN